jgi:hypothetical protein
VRKVDAAGVPGMAAPEAFESKPAASYEPIALQGFDGVVRAGRMKTTDGSEQRADRPLIKPDHGYRDGAHFCITSLHRACKDVRNSPPGTPRARLRALTTRSSGGSSCWCSRNHSRITRLKRLRSTPVPATLRETARPNRADGVPFRRAVAANNVLPHSRPAARSASNSAFRRMRRCAGNVYRTRSGKSASRRRRL